MSTTDFMGRDGFIWFAGVVEDRQDPLKLGRVRVRCLGYHTEDKEALPTADLPWAHPLLPITSSGVSGIGLNSSRPYLKGVGWLAFLGMQIQNKTQ